MCGAFNDLDGNAYVSSPISVHKICGDSAHKNAFTWISKDFSMLAYVVGGSADDPSQIKKWYKIYTLAGANVYYSVDSGATYTAYTGPLSPPIRSKIFRVKLTVPADGGNVSYLSILSRRMDGKR